jgi:ABC-2 type transport system ATP-binding protein
MESAHQYLAINEAGVFMSINLPASSPLSSQQQRSSEYAIITDGLSRTFGSIQAVSNLALSVPVGQIFGFLGTNGAGKTTTIHLLLGLLEPTAGEAHVLGYDIRTHADRIREESGVLLEHHGLYEQLSAFDNLDFYGRIWGMSRAERAARINELLEILDLRDRARDRVVTWSRGMKQKLAIARAIFHHPRLVFLDEPTDGLDPVAAAALRQDLVTLVTQEGTTIFLTTHNLAEAEQICDTVAIIRSGILLAQGSPSTLRERAGMQIVIRGKGFSPAILAGLSIRSDIKLITGASDEIVFVPRGTVDTSQIVTSLINSGAQVAQVNQIVPSFEETFLHIIERGSAAFEQEHNDER